MSPSMVPNVSQVCAGIAKGGRPDRRFGDKAEGNKSLLKGDGRTAAQKASSANYLKGDARSVSSYCIIFTYLYI
eukprot:COSAG01_NODE_31_length_35900_cov_44.332169_28_plen_74_part_00